MCEQLGFRELILDLKRTICKSEKLLDDLVGTPAAVCQPISTIVREEGEYAGCT